MLFLAVKLCPAPFKLGGIGPTDVCFPQSHREEIVAENEALPDFWLEVMLFWGRWGEQLVPQPGIILWLCPVVGFDWSVFVTLCSQNNLQERPGDLCLCGMQKGENLNEVTRKTQSSS